MDDLDITVRDVRAEIFELHTARLPGRSIRQELIQLCRESARALGFEPELRLDGPIDTAVSDSLADELFAVLREALTNIAKHACAKSGEVSVDARDPMLTAMVNDHGVGYRGDAALAAGGELAHPSYQAPR